MLLLDNAVAIYTTNKTRSTTISNVGVLFLALAWTTQRVISKTVMIIFGYIHYSSIAQPDCDTRPPVIAFT